MRVSPRLHVLAFLREALGKNQKEFASCLGVSQVYLKKIELLKEPLSLALAQKIVRITGVSLEWLLGNQLDIPLPSDIKTRFLKRQAPLPAGSDEAAFRAIQESGFSPVMVNELVTVALRLGCRLEDEAEQLRWLSRLAGSYAKSLEQAEL